MIVGQALQGWDDPAATARWHAADVRTEEGRARVLERTEAWARHRDEPLWEVVRHGKRSGAPFWQLAKAFVPLLEPHGHGPWYSRYAWWNVYPLGWEQPDEGPTGALLEAQKPFARDLFWSVLDDLGADRVVLVSGKSWWPEVRPMLDLEAMRPGTAPVIASGLVRNRQVVASYHPRGARMQGISNQALADVIAEAMCGLRAAAAPQESSR